MPQPFFDDEGMRRDLDSVSETEWKNSHAFNHEIAWYGVEALACTYIAGKSKEAIREGISVEDLVKRYELDNFEGEGQKGRIGGGFTCSVQGLRKDSIFIPRLKDDRRISLFDIDHTNKFGSPRHPFGSLTTEDVENAFELVDYNRGINSWSYKDLRDEEKLRKALKFGKDMWKRCVESFEKYKEPSPIHTRGDRVLEWSPGQPQKVTDLGRKIIVYWGSIIDLAGKD